MSAIEKSFSIRRLLVLVVLSGCGPTYKSAYGEWTSQASGGGTLYSQPGTTAPVDYRYTDDSTLSLFINDKNFLYLRLIKQTDGARQLAITVNGRFSGGDAAGTGYSTPIITVDSWKVETENGTFTEYTPMQGLNGDYSCASVPNFEHSFCFLKGELKNVEYDGKDKLDIEDLSGERIQPTRTQSFKRKS